MERIVALIDGDGVVKNLIVADDSWDLGGVDVFDYAVGIGHRFNFVDKLFYDENNVLVKTNEQLRIEAEARANLLVNQ